MRAIRARKFPAKVSLVPADDENKSNKTDWQCAGEDAAYSVSRYSITIIIICNNIVLLSFSSSAAAAPCFTTLLLLLVSRTDTLVLRHACTTRVSETVVGYPPPSRRATGVGKYNHDRQTEFVFENKRSYVVRKAHCRWRVRFVYRIDTDYNSNRLI